MPGQSPSRWRLVWRRLRLRWRAERRRFARPVAKLPSGDESPTTAKTLPAIGVTPRTTTGEGRLSPQLLLTGDGPSPRKDDGREQGEEPTPFSAHLHPAAGPEEEAPPPPAEQDVRLGAAVTARREARRDTWERRCERASGSVPDLSSRPPTPDSADSDGDVATVHAFALDTTPPPRLTTNAASMHTSPKRIARSTRQPPSAPANLPAAYGHATATDA